MRSRWGDSDGHHFDNVVKMVSDVLSTSAEHTIPVTSTVWRSTAHFVDVNKMGKIKLNISIKEQSYLVYVTFLTA
jgi:hypothetical protein